MVIKQTLDPTDCSWPTMTSVLKMATAKQSCRLTGSQQLKGLLLSLGSKCSYKYDGHELCLRTKTLHHHRQHQHSPLFYKISFVRHYCVIKSHGIIWLRCKNLYSKFKSGRTTYFHMKFSLSSAYSLLSAYALKTYSNRRMRLITRFYGIIIIMMI